jgi:NADH:ubiquinone reductase (H+-translocating)
MRVSGFPAWVLWLTVHICFLVGFRNRFVVLLHWVWQYLTSRGGARIITGSNANLRWPAQPRRLARSSIPSRAMPGPREDAPARAG